MKILETKNITYAYKDGDRERVILKDVNAEFEKGKFYTILGVSGSGKTTFLSLISALDLPQKGTIEYLGKDIKDIGLDLYRRKNIAIIFQSYNLINYMTAIENVILSMGISQENHHISSNEALKYLEQVGIDDAKAKRIVTKLSGGEQQRVAIARALSRNVDIIVADEPTGNLDQNTSQQIVDLLKKFAHEQNKCIIMVTHSHKIAEQSDIILKLDTDTHNFVVENEND